MSKFEKTEIGNPETVASITAHYLTAKHFIERQKTFTNVATFHRWEKWAFEKGYNVNCVDIERKVEMKTVRNLMTQKEIQIPVDTPRCADPSTELYWSM